jgi:hypothetical protein
MIFATFPHQALIGSIKFWLVGHGTPPEQSLTGATVRTSNNSAHWRAEASFSMYDEESYLAWQGFVAQMRGTLGETLVPAFGRYTPRDGQGRKMSHVEAVSLPQNGFGDNSGFAQTDTVRAKLTNFNGRRKSNFNVTLVNATGLRPGHVIGIGDRRHEIMAASDLGDGSVDVAVNPVLRFDYSANTEVLLDRPVCRMQFATTDEGRLAYDMATAQTATVNFVECIS